MNISHSYQNTICVCWKYDRDKASENIFIKNWKGKVVGANAITTCRISVTTSSILLVVFDSIGEYPAATGQKQE